MNTYKLQIGYPGVVRSVTIIGQNISVPISEDNTDYARFKKEINEETAELQDADGNTMASAEAKAYVATLP